MFISYCFFFFLKETSTETPVLRFPVQFLVMVFFYCFFCNGNQWIWKSIFIVIFKPNNTDRFFLLL